MTNDVKPDLVIIRGLPGSGKSTLASEKFSNYTLLENDQFFTMDYGCYNYEPNLARTAAEWCQCQTYFHLMRGHNVVVANTFVRLEYIFPYITIARYYAGSISLIECYSEYKNIHLVPDEAVKRMKSQWENSYLLTPFFKTVTRIGDVE